MQKIASICSCKQRKIRTWMDKFGIERRIQSEAMKGNKNGAGERSVEFRKKMSIAMEGNKNNLDHKLSEKTKKKISKANKGRKFTEEHKRKLRENHWDSSRENNPNWAGGVSFERYAPEFNEKTRKRIRERDENRCQFCGTEKNVEKVQAHHIDYDKQSNGDLNLISLCRSCNNRANHDRPKWQFLFETIQELRFMRA